MRVRSLLSHFAAAVAGVSMLATSLSPASALPIGDSSLGQSFAASSEVQDVWYCRWNCGGWHPGWGYRAGWGWQPGWRGPGWQGPGWGPGAVVGGVLAGAVVGAAVAGPPVVYGGPCWRRWVGPYGGVHWRRVC
jgi:hypothetical protein